MNELHEGQDSIAVSLLTILPIDSSKTPPVKYDVSR